MDVRPWHFEMTHDVITLNCNKDNNVDRMNDDGTGIANGIAEKNPVVTKSQHNIWLGLFFQCTRNKHAP